MTGRPALVINGETREFDGAVPETVMALVQLLGFDPGMVVAEVNGGIVRRQDFPTHALAPGDSIELVRFVGGG